jgi:hypothetical protein
VNHTTAARVFIEGVQTLWPVGVKFDSVVLLVTDAAQYVEKATKGLNELPKTDTC